MTFFFTDYKDDYDMWLFVLHKTSKYAFLLKDKFSTNLRMSFQLI